MRIEKMIHRALVESKQVDRKFRHVSFITTKKGRIITVGTNKRKTHPLNFLLGYKSVEIHSELDAYKRLSYHDKGRTLYLYNFRFNKNDKLGMSKPCVYCLPWCTEVFDKIWFSQDDGICQLF